MAQHTYFLVKEVGQPDRLLVWDTRTLHAGRGPDNALVLDDEGVSRRHAIFTKEGDRCEVGDHQTGNGTLLNGQRVAGTQLIQHGDTITIGKFELEFCATQEHPAKRGMKLEYASHLMTGGMVPQGGNADATMVGIMDGGGADDEFVIEHNDGTGSDLFADDALVLDSVADSAPDSAPVRDLDLDFVDAPVAAPVAPAPAPAPAADPNESSQTDPVERMRRLKSLLSEGLISEAEFEQKRAQILKDV